MIDLLIFLLINPFNIFSQVSQYDKPQRIKVDGVSAVVGDYIILESDIDKAIVEMESQGMSVKNITRCELLGKLMEDKLYAHNAIQDSLEVTDQEIYDYVDQSIAYFTDQLGSIEKVLEFYRKPDELSFRDELFQINKIQKLSSMMQSKIVDEAALTQQRLTLVVQVNGKVRGQIDVAADAEQADILDLAKAEENVARHLEAKTVRKEIYVPNKLVNIVVG